MYVVHPVQVATDLRKFYGKQVATMPGKHPNLTSRDAREKLRRRKEPHWRPIYRGLAIGYYKGQRGGAWYARRLVNGHYELSVIGTADDRPHKADGREFLNYEQALERVQLWGGTEPDELAPHSFTVSDAMDAYLDYLEGEGKTSSHRETRIANDAHIKPKLGGDKVAKLTSRRIERWKHDLAKSPLRRGKQRIQIDKADDEAVRKRRASVNRILTYLKAALNRAHAHRRLPNADAWREVKPFRRADAPRIRYLSRDDAVRLLNKCPDDFRQVVRAALLTGARYSELTKARVHDFDAESSTLLVRHPKGNTPRHVPLTSEGVKFFETVTAGRAGDEFLFLRADGEPWMKGHQTRRLREACAAAKIKPAVGFHILRHSYATWLVRKGVSLRFVSEAIGASVRMVERHYGHVAPQDLQKAIQGALPRLGGVRGKIQRIR